MFLSLADSIACLCRALSLWHSRRASLASAVSATCCCRYCSLRRASRASHCSGVSLVAILEWSLQLHTTGDDDMCAVGVAAHAQTASRRQIYIYIYIYTHIYIEKLPPS